jgi:hypothetical protein
MTYFRTYCKYHHHQHHHQNRTFESPEDEMRHFLEKMGRPDWVWAEQYERTEREDETMLMEDSDIFFVDNGTESMLLCVVWTLLYGSWQSVFVTNTLTL